MKKNYNKKQEPLIVYDYLKKIVSITKILSLHLVQAIKRLEKYSKKKVWQSVLNTMKGNAH